jgi:hypothetical protein
MPLCFNETTNFNSFSDQGTMIAKAMADKGEDAVRHLAEAAWGSYPLTDSVQEEECLTPP